MVDEQMKKNEVAKPEDADVAKLRAVFPDCFTKNGAVDFEKLQAKFDGKVKIENEGYRLDFLGKSYARLLTALETTTVVKPDLEHNQKPENAKSRNVYLTADNLDALKQLVKSYAGEVKMIYIDPPYNTGSDGFVYNDKFNFTEKELCDKLGVDEQQAKRILGFTKRNASSHSAWLTFMYPRLVLARELLTKDGVIFISIDDNEQANLKLLCDDVFGEEKFAAIFPWRKRTAKTDVPYGVSQDYEWVVCYAMSGSFRAAIVGGERKYFESDDFPGRRWRIHDMATQRTAKERPNSDFTMVNPKNGDEFPVNPNAVWRVTKETFQTFYTQNRIVFPGDYDFLNITNPVLRYWENDDREKEGRYFGTKPVSTNLPKSVGMSEDGTKEITELFEFKVFPYPKPVNLLKFLVEIATDKDSAIVDFFSGSGTLGQAVMNQNLQDGGKRRFILAQLPEPCDPTKEAFSHGFRTIDEIGRKRIELAAEKIRTENPEKAATLDLGFKHYTLVEPGQETLDKVESFDKAASLVGDEGMLKEFGLETVLATWMVRDGYGFGVEPEVVKFGGYAAYWQGKHLYFVKDGLGEQGVKDLMDRYETDPKFSPVNVVVFGYGVSMTMRENLKTNLAKLVDSEKDLKVNIEVRY